MTEEDRMQVIDDGTLDTVVRCGGCGAEIRYTFQADGGDDTLEEFVAWALQDAEDSHECPRRVPA